MYYCKIKPYYRIASCRSNCGKYCLVIVCIVGIAVNPHKRVACSYIIDKNILWSMVNPKVETNKTIAPVYAL